MSDAPTRRRAAGGYHHGDLQRALAAAAIELIEERGIAELSLRELARRAGVSHAAPAHHFGDRAGLFTAVATEGFKRFKVALETGRDAAGEEPLARFAGAGRAYVHFAVAERGSFELMFRPEFLRMDDAALLEASRGSYGVLLGCVEAAQRAGFAADRDPQAVALGAWAGVHGLAKLWLDGSLAPHAPGVTLDEAIDMVLTHGAS